MRCLLVPGVPDHSPTYPRYAHDVLTDYVAKQGFEIKKNHVLPTGWEAKFSHGSGGRTIGVNSGDQRPLSNPLSVTSHGSAEMDALPGVGHACGHNLIAISGVAVACAIKKAIVKHNISGTVILLGTPGGCSSAVIFPSKTECIRRGGRNG